MPAKAKTEQVICRIPWTANPESQPLIRSSGLPPAPQLLPRATTAIRKSILSYMEAAEALEYRGFWCFLKVTTPMHRAHRRSQSPIANLVSLEISVPCATHVRPPPGLHRTNTGPPHECRRQEAETGPRTTDYRTTAQSHPARQQRATSGAPAGHPHATPLRPTSHHQGTTLKLPSGSPQATPERRQIEECRMKNGRQSCPGAKPEARRQNTGPSLCVHSLVRPYRIAGVQLVGTYRYLAGYLSGT